MSYLRALTVFHLLHNMQVVELDGPLFCLSWCKRKKWLLVGGKAQLHVYSVGCYLFTASQQHDIKHMRRFPTSHISHFTSVEIAYNRCMLCLCHQAVR